MARNLHIGGWQAHPDWEILDALPGEHVDHLGDAVDLSRFPDESFDALYASHVLEHFDYQGPLGAALREWRRVLKPGGRLFISVPDLEVLATLFLQREQLAPAERFHVMRMIYGGHMNAYDQHHVGFDFDILCHFLAQAGFKRADRVAEFNIFEDTSRLQVHGVPISLNVVAFN